MEETLCRVVMFCSRNKDNQDVEGFEQRHRNFVSDKTNEELISLFQEFVNGGVPGEFCRLYVSVNNRDNNKVVKNLTHWLIDNPDQDVSHMESRVASIAMKSECRAEKKWMFDFDEVPTLFDKFVEDVHSCDPEVEVFKYKTPNGLCVVTSRGFDTRGLDLGGKWKNVELKKDASRCLFWDMKETKE